MSEVEGVSPTLDPVVVAGLLHLEAYVFWGWSDLGDVERDSASRLLDRPRSSMVHCLRALHASGYEIPPHLLYRWALGRRWPQPFAVALRDLALGTESGVRFSANPAPLILRSVEQWAREVEQDPDAFKSGDLERTRTTYPLIAD